MFAVDGLAALGASHDLYLMHKASSKPLQQQQHSTGT